MLEQIIFVLFNAFIFYIIISFLKKKSYKLPLYKHFNTALTIKILAGVSVGLIYRYYYKGGDTFMLFNDGEILREIAFNSPAKFINFLFFNTYTEPADILDQLSNSNVRAVLQAKFICFTNILTGGNYWISSIYFSLFAFVGIWYCANTLVKYIPNSNKAASIAFFYFPSFVFWSSGILKESILIGCIGGIIAIFLPIIEIIKRKTYKVEWGKIILGIILTYIVFKLKYYYLGAFLPALMAYAITTVLIQKMAYLKQYGVIICISIFSFILALATFTHPNLKLDVFLSVLVENTFTMSEQTDTKANLIAYNTLTPDLSSIITNLPKAYWEGTFRPYFGEEGAILKQVAGLENMVFIVFIILSTIKIRNFEVKKEYQMLLICGILYIALLTPLLAIAAPNLGTLARYKAGYTPFLVYIFGIVFFNDWKKKGLKKVTS